MYDNVHQLRFNEDFQKKVGGNLRAGTPMIKFKNDPRITKVGHFIRKTSIDELPQFFCVLKGDMSLVGPRPHEPEEVAHYAKHHRKLLTLKPGITGLSQISGRSDLDFEEEVKLDIFYIENWSLVLDVIILIKTPLVLFKSRKAS
jgi:lipopolysaccharide/colanic/teichoic acid biosynthesis glycosyltransferase